MPVPPSFPVPADSIIHLIGIGGTGMSPLATVLKQAGYTITGSDLHRSPAVDALIELGVPIAIGHAPANVTGASLVIRSSAVPDSNAEVRQALHLGMRVLKHAEFLGLLSRTRRTLAVAGTHGKTTTTAMLATILLAAELDPTVLVGGVMPLLGSGARLGSSQFLVVEADEFDRRFLELRPEIAIVTNVEADHLDYFGDLPAIEQAFREFLAPVPDQGWVVAGADDPVAAALAVERPSNAVTFGLSALAEWRAVGISRNELGGNDFYVQAHGTLVGHFHLPVPGLHNVYDALAAIVAAGRVGVDFTVAAAALESFATVERRLERKGGVANIVVYDDYAHNPTKIRASLAALREQHEGRIICLYQPHTY
ncbi:MAG: UDP-N-acetylmuramate--L-alanine ligase, partial [Chloroflexota bacterium]